MANHRDEQHQFETKLLHWGSEMDPHYGASNVPIYQCSTFHQEDVDNPPEHDYTRSGNPTRQAVEDQIAYLEGGARGFAFASGMAAISTAFFLLSAGDHVIVTEDVYGGTYRILTTLLKQMNIESTFVDMTNIDEVKAALKPNTKAVYMETPSNPTLRITDIRTVCDWAHANGLLTMLDNTFMTPYHQKSIPLGVDVVLHSATKFLGGHSDVLAGLAVAANDSIGRRLKGLQNSLGNVAGQFDSWLLMRGIKTLAVRMEQHESSARKLAQWLVTDPRVVNVFYPGLPNHPGRVVHESQSKGYGAIVSFDVGSGERAREVMSKVKLPLVAVSLGAVESILSYPPKMSHAAMPQEVRMARGITDGVLRFSVGLENIDDLIADLDQALGK